MSRGVGPELSYGSYRDLTGRAPWLRLQHRPQALDLIVPPIAVQDSGGTEAKLARTADALNYKVTKVTTSCIRLAGLPICAAGVFPVHSEFALECLVEDGRQQGVKLGGGLRLKPCGCVHPRL